MRSIRSAINGLVPRAWLLVGRSAFLTGQIIALPMVYRGLIREAANTYVSGHDSGDASVRRIASFIQNAVAWHA
ncbi:hypothetical protein ASG77_11645 [Arthrobacter sp. Soil762]|nr:hypothetical protein ASG77_11645 [Arthrobacter sp. Soil762]